jgi:hydroxyethylthiazole kinase-like uncharacterized protein yjeF
MPESTVVDGNALLAGWPLRDPRGSSDKDERGAVVVLGGARGMPGAVLLAGIAALRVGAGKLTIGTSDAHAAPLAVGMPEAGVFGLPTTGSGAISAKAIDEVIELAEDADAVLFGPGTTDPDETRALLTGVMDGLDRNTVVVLDAIGATCGVLSDGLGPARDRTVITPNTTEAGYLLDDLDGDDADIACRLAARYGVTAVLGSCIARPDRSCWTIPKGNPGLGTSGSGDVLAGAVAGVAARTHDPVAAAMWGRLLHSAAGDRLANRVGILGFLARELLDELPGCLRDLSH